jgi:hypothetical protein
MEKLTVLAAKQRANALGLNPSQYGLSSWDGATSQDLANALNVSIRGTVNRNKILAYPGGSRDAVTGKVLTKEKTDQIANTYDKNRAIAEITALGKNYYNALYSPFYSTALTPLGKQRAEEAAKKQIQEVYERTKNFVSPTEFNEIFGKTIQTENNLQVNRYEELNKPDFLSTFIPFVTQVGFSAVTGGLTLPQQLAINSAASLAQGKKIEDVVKSAIGSLAASQVPEFLKELNNKLPDNSIYDGVINAERQVAYALVTGNDVKTAALAGLAGGAIAGKLYQATDREGISKAAGEYMQAVASGRSPTDAMMSALMGFAEGEFSEAKKNIEQEVEAQTQAKRAQADAEVRQNQIVEAFSQPKSPGVGEQIGEPTAELAGGIQYGSRPGALGTNIVSDVDLPTINVVPRLGEVEVVGSKPSVPTASETMSDVLATITEKSPTTEVPKPKTGPSAPTPISDSTSVPELKPALGLALGLAPKPAPIVPTSVPTAIPELPPAPPPALPEPPAPPAPPAQELPPVIPEKDKQILDFIGLKPEISVTPPAPEPAAKPVSVPVPVPPAPVPVPQEPPTLPAPEPVAPEPEPASPVPPAPPVPPASPVPTIIPEKDRPIMDLAGIAPPAATPAPAPVVPEPEPVPPVPPVTPVPPASVPPASVPPITTPPPPAPPAPAPEPSPKPEKPVISEQDQVMLDLTGITKPQPEAEPKPEAEPQLEEEAVVKKPTEEDVTEKQSPILLSLLNNLRDPAYLGAPSSVPSTSALAQALSVGDPGALYLGKKGKERKPVWNVESLKLKDELGGDYG